MPDTAVQPPRLGRCLNQGRCTLADSNAHIPLEPDAPLDCPECHMPIVERPRPGKPPLGARERPKLPRRVIALAAFVAVTITGGIAFDLFARDEPDEVGEAAEMVPEAETLAEPMTFEGRTTNIMMFTLGATPETRDTLAPALAAAFLAQKGCSTFAESRVANNRLRLRCTRESVRFYIDIAPTDSATAFDPGPRRPIDLLITTETATGKQPRDPTIIGFSAAALIVNPGNPVRRLSLDQAAAVMAGRIDNFAEVGGRDAGIRRIAAGDRDLAVTSFAALAPGGGRLAINTRRLADGPAVASAVAGDPDAIGLINPVDSGGGRVLAIGAPGTAVLPSPAAISEARYPLAQRLRIDIPRGSKIRYARPFAAFATSADGQAHVKSAGYIGLPPDRITTPPPPPPAKAP